MKKTYLILLSCLFFLGSSAQSNVQIVNRFISAFNSKDSVAAFSLLHQDFVELWQKDTVIHSKKDYAKNYAWGRVMNDREDIEIVKQNKTYVVETISTYSCDRDKLLGISPYKSKRVYQIKEGKILKIVGGVFDGYEAYDQPRRDQYQVFFKWLLENYDLKPEDLPFDKKGAEELKKILAEYQKHTPPTDSENKKKKTRTSIKNEEVRLWMTCCVKIR